MTEHNNNEAAQAIIKLAYQQMQTVPHAQMVQQPQPQQPAPKPTVGQRVSGGLQVAKGVDSFTKSIRKQNRKEQMADHAKGVASRLRGRGVGRFRAALAARGSAKKKFGGPVKGIVTQAVGDMTKKMDLGLSGFQKGMKSRAAKEIESNTKTASRVLAYGAGQAMQTAAQGSVGDRVKRRMKMVADTYRAGRDESAARRNRAATALRDRGREAARAAESAKHPEVKRGLQQKATEAGNQAKDLKRTGRLGLRDMRSGVGELASRAILPTTRKQNVVEKGGRALKAATRDSAMFKRTADAAGKKVDRILGNR